jgi:large subunit ribosomal protein L6
MSRIGKQPIDIPKGVTVEAKAGSVAVKGPKGDLSIDLRPEVAVEVTGNQAQVSAINSSRGARAFHGMTRALINNMVVGVSAGYEKTLEIHGVGWNASVEGRVIALSVGYCNPIKVDIPDGIEVTTPNPTTIMISGADKQLVGQVAASVRSSRPPEPYKGKGVRYRGEYVRQKAGKSFGT